MKIFLQRALHRRAVVGFAVGAMAASTPFLALAREAPVQHEAPSPHESTRPLPYQSKDKTLGVVTCASSLCHGSITEWQGSNIRQNEYVTWLRTDKHAGAARVLLNAQSKRIASNLGLKEPPEKSKVCLDCHAHNPSPETAGPRARFIDGVTCEGCHGPAETWVASHSLPGATHEQNVAHGLYPTDRPVERARLCLSCHFGNNDRLVTHRMMGAGHPRLSFELETFTSLAPQHFTIDADYVKRKGAWSGVKVWAIGQALAVSETMKILTSPTRGRDGIFPELVVFDCHACHHPMSQLRWTPVTPFGRSPGPGTPRLNDSSLLMLRAILRVVDPAKAEELTAQTALVHRAATGDGDLVSAGRELGAMAEQAAQQISSTTFDDATLRGVALALVDEGLTGQYRDYAAAEQSVMAIGSVLNYMQTRGLIQNGAELNRGLRSIREPLASDDTYRPAEFLERLKAFRRLVAETPPLA
ncbi:MAG: multiheme c-type cytochrome [Vicinamibacteria bacterium]